MTPQFSGGGPANNGEADYRLAFHVFLGLITILGLTLALISLIPTTWIVGGFSFCLSTLLLGAIFIDGLVLIREWRRRSRFKRKTP